MVESDDNTADRRESLGSSADDYQCPGSDNSENLNELAYEFHELERQAHQEQESRPKAEVAADLHYSQHRSNEKQKQHVASNKKSILL